MKHKLLAVLGLAATVFVISGSAATAQAAEVVGSESYEVSWHGMPASDQSDSYQVFYGQANNANKLEYSVFDGLIATSRSVRLNYLKPCTEYSWSLKGRRTGVWSWIISDRRFTTGGICEAAKAFVPSGVSLVNDVNVQTWATGNKTGSSTISWSPTPQASEYRVYYRPAWEAKYVHSIRVPGNGTSVTIGYLQPGAQYFYRVAAVVDGREKWYAEKTLQTTTGAKPVLGVTSTNPVGVLGTNDSMMRKSGKACTMNGMTNVSIRVPRGISSDKVHVLFGTEPGKYMHALRDVSTLAREVTIRNLDTCKKYYYQVVVMGQDGKGYWQGEWSAMPQ